MRRMARVFLSLAGVCILGTLTTFRSPEAKGLSGAPHVPAARFVPDAQEFTLENGMTVIVVPDHRVPVVTHMLAYRVGAADEMAGKTGLAHFLEHLLFKGTEAYPGDSVTRLVSRLGGELNAMTSSDYTVYYERVGKDHLKMLMTLEADRMVNLVLSEDDVRTERSVVFEERLQRVDNDPKARLWEEVSAVLYRVHPYGNPVIGWANAIQSLSREEVFDFYRRYYSPANAMLVVVGDVTREDVERYARETYGRIPGSGNVPVREWAVEPPRHVETSVQLRDDVKQSLYVRCYAVPSYGGSDRTLAASLSLLSDMLGGSQARPLYQDLVMERKLATSVVTNYRGGVIGDGLFIVYVVPAEGVSFSELGKAIDAQIERMARGGVEAGDLDRSRNLFLAESIYAQDSQFGLAHALAVFRMVGLSLDEIQSWPELISSITADQVVLAASLLKPSTAVTGILLPHAGKNGADEGDSREADSRASGG